MTEHLPECNEMRDMLDPGEWVDEATGEAECVLCHMLRACEQRVRQSAATMWDRTSEQMAAARVEGIRAGLDAAREAVAAVPHGISWGTGLHIHRERALAAIDALKEKP